MRFLRTVLASFLAHLLTSEAAIASRSTAPSVSCPHELSSQIPPSGPDFQKLSETQLYEALGRLAGGQFHDLNNLLTVIGGYAQLATCLLNPEANPQVCEYLDQIREAALRAGQITREALDLHRKKPVKKKEIDLSVLIRQTLELLKGSRPTNLDTRVYLCPDLPRLVGYENQIHQVIMNLVKNAFHAMKDRGGSLIVSAKSTVFKEPKTVGRQELPPGTYLELVVSDTGRGIPEDILPKIFDLHFTSKPESEGSGIGLAMVYSIIRSHGGSIEIRSKVGEGTSAVVLLPATI